MMMMMLMTLGHFPMPIAMKAWSNLPLRPHPCTQDRELLRNCEDLYLFLNKTNTPTPLALLSVLKQVIL